MHALRAADEAHRSHAVAEAVDGPVGGLADGRVIRQPEVVVGAEVDDIPVTGAYLAALGAAEHSLALVERLFPKVCDLRTKALNEAFSHGGELYSWNMDEDSLESARIDRWLFFVRLYKSRSFATQAVNGGKVHLNGERTKPSHAIRPGDRITFMRGRVAFECVVKAIPARRGPATEAAQCYDETPESQARRVEFAARMKIANVLTPRPDERPNKHARRELRRLRGRN